MDIEKKRRNRDNFLLRLYMLADGSTNKSFIMYEIGKECGISDEETDDIASYFSSKAYIRIRTKDRDINLLTPGVDYIEDLYLSSKQVFSERQTKRVVKRINKILKKENKKFQLNPDDFLKLHQSKYEVTKFNLGKSILNTLILNGIYDLAKFSAFIIAKSFLGF